MDGVFDFFISLRFLYLLLIVHISGNHEEQFYTDSRKNARCERGRLIIEAHKVKTYISLKLTFYKLIFRNIVTTIGIHQLVFGLRRHGNMVVGKFVLNYPRVVVFGRLSGW
jgi:hypothetical protein